MTISYGPYAFGSPFITWVGFFTIAGILVGGILFACAMPRQGASRRTSFRLVLISVFGGLVGARLFHVLDYQDFFTGAPFHIFYLWEAVTPSGAAYWADSRWGFGRPAGRALSASP